MCIELDGPTDRRMDGQADGQTDSVDVKVRDMTYIWVKYNDLTATSLGIIVNKRNYPKIALFQVSEL